jgi:hypothetical protein
MLRTSPCDRSRLTDITGGAEASLTSVYWSWPLGQRSHVSVQQNVFRSQLIVEDLGVPVVAILFPSLQRLTTRFNDYSLPHALPSVYKPSTPLGDAPDTAVNSPEHM